MPTDGISVYTTYSSGRVMASSVRFYSFPRTRVPPAFVPQIVSVFQSHETSIATELLTKGLESDSVLQVLAADLASLGFSVETGKKRDGKIKRPVFFGENGVPSLRYEIDAYHNDWKCGVEIEAGRATMGNAVFRDLFQAMVMTDVEHLCLAVPNAYRYNSANKPMVSKDYEKTVAIADALFGHDRMVMPYGLTIIGY
jgi:hypothetical protein